ncbi:MAG: diacylglycerol/lipid kinase family protein [Aquaticitalea sp.]
MDSKNKILLVVNPISGNSGKEELLERLNMEINRQGLELLKYETTGTDDEQHIQKIVDSKPIHHVLVAGGDGTIQLVAKAIHDRNISVGILPAGSANGLASNLKLTDDIDTQIEIALSSNSIEMDLLSINDHICLHIADIGVNAELIKNFENSSLRGKLGYALHTIPTLIASDYPYHFKINVNDETFESEGILIAIANAKQFGTGAIINPNGHIDDGLFEVVIFKKLDVIDIFKTLNEHNEMDSEFMEYRSTKTAVITCEKPISLQIDGEYIGEVTELKASLLPTKLKVMVPEGFN